MLVYRPDGDIDHTSACLADPVVTLAARRVAVLDNGKPNAATVMTYAAEALVARTGARLALVVKKGPGGRSANAAVPCAPDVFERLRGEADVVITGAADCGSCTAYSVHDTVELERVGIPTVLLTTTKFRPVVAALAHDTGLSDIRVVVVDHPIGGVDRETLRTRGEAASERLVELFTGARPFPNVAIDHVAGTEATAARALAELRALVAPDGADLELLALDDAAGTVRLRLLLPDAEGVGCVMPRAALEQAAVARLALHGFTTVVIDDPREPAIGTPTASPTP